MKRNVNTSSSDLTDFSSISDWKDRHKENLVIVPTAILTSIPSVTTLKLNSDCDPSAVSFHERSNSISSCVSSVTSSNSGDSYDGDQSTDVSYSPTESESKYYQASESCVADVRGPYKVQTVVHLILEKWGPTFPISPDKFLLNLLSSRGYEDKLIKAKSSIYRSPEPLPKQLADYDNELLYAISDSNLNSLKRLMSSGRSMSACNRFSESIVHMACRRSDFEVVEFIVNNGGNIFMVDDFGRTPLHDACWRPIPRFDIVTLLLDKDLTLLRLVDERGAMPLHYVREEHWLQWCAYFFHQKEKYWAILDQEVANNRMKDMQNYSKFDIQQSFQSLQAQGPLYWQRSDDLVDLVQVDETSSNSQPNLKKSVDNRTSRKRRRI